jgi:hypothetical protein
MLGKLPYAGKWGGLIAGEIIQGMDEREFCGTNSLPAPW